MVLLFFISCPLHYIVLVWFSIPCSETCTYYFSSKLSFFISCACIQSLIIFWYVFSLHKCSGTGKCNCLHHVASQIHGIELFKQSEVINSVGPVLETEAAPSDHYENAPGPSAPSRKDLYRQVSHRVCEWKEFYSCYTIIVLYCFIFILHFPNEIIMLCQLL